jgi:RNA polymerase primary sigma factor
LRRGERTLFGFGRSLGEGARDVTKAKRPQSKQLQQKTKQRRGTGRLAGRVARAGTSTVGGPADVQGDDEVASHNVETPVEGVAGADSEFGSSPKGSELAFGIEQADAELLAAESLEGAVEAADEEEEAPEPVETASEASVAPKREDQSNHLATYFRDMAGLDVLKPEQEFEAARHIEALETELWTRLLAFPPLVDHLLKVVERSLDNSLKEFVPLRRLAKEASAEKVPGGRGAVRMVAAARKVGERLRALDLDRRYVEVAMGELDSIAVTGVGRVIPGLLPIQHRGKPFLKYRQSARATSNQVKAAKNEFVKANLRLVVSIARRFNYGRMPLADLIQEGNIGLIKAVERFDYRRGYRFSTYASWWIRHAISRALADKGRAVRLPVHMIDAYHRIARANRDLSAKLGRQPTTEEIGEATQIPPAKIEKMRTYLADQSFSLDRPVSDEDGRRFIDFVADPEADERSPADRMAEEALTDEVRRLLGDLKPIEADILRQRFGLDTDEELTLKEIGEKYKLSRERIRQLQEQALSKMRRALQRMDML